VSARPLLRIAGGAALAVGVGAACAVFVHALDFRTGVCPDSLVERPRDDVSPRRAPSVPPEKSTAGRHPDDSPAR
jgi:hypothetical protein